MKFRHFLILILLSVIASSPAISAPAGALASLNAAEMQLRQCLVASKNRRDLGNPNPNCPDTPRLTIGTTDFGKLTAYFTVEALREYLERKGHKGLL